MTIKNTIVVGVLAVSGAFAVQSNATKTTENNLSNTKQVSLVHAADEAAFSVSREQNRASRNKSPQNNILVKFSKQRDQLDPLELKSVLYIAGFRGQNLKEAWAVVMKESNGRPMAHNTNSSTGDNSYGIFQINMIGSLGPERREKFDLSSNDDLFNPVKNAQIAFYMSQGGKNWSSWDGLGTRTQEWMKKFPSE